MNRATVSAKLTTSSRPLTSIDTVMFDLDGTLVRSLDRYHEVFVDVFVELGLPVVEKDAILDLMRHGSNIMETLVPPDWPDREAIKERGSLRFREVWAKRATVALELHPEAVTTIHTLAERGFRLGLATAASGQWIPDTLALNGLSDCFSAVVTCGDVPVRKPAPDLLIECLKRLGSTFDRSVYVGDSPIDIMAAKAAGVRSVGVLSGASDRATLEDVVPDLILDHVGQLLAILGPVAG